MRDSQVFPPWEKLHLDVFHVALALLPGVPPKRGLQLSNRNPGKSEIHYFWCF